MDKIMINYTTDKPQGYVIGGLFSDSQVRQRLYEGKLLKENTNINFYNPIEADINDKSKLPTADDIFNGDTEKLLKSNHVVIDLADNDIGASCETGIVWMSNYIHYLAEQGYSLQDILTYIPKKKVVAHLSDIRKETAHLYKHNYLPIGWNQYLIPCVEQIGEIYNHFEEALQNIREVSNAE